LNPLPMQVYHSLFSAVMKYTGRPVGKKVSMAHQHLIKHLFAIKKETEKEVVVQNVILWQVFGPDNGGMDATSPEPMHVNQSFTDKSVGLWTTGTVLPDYSEIQILQHTIANLLRVVSDFSNETLGHEWDPESPSYASFYPANRITLSNTLVFGQVHKLSLYKRSSGALVFGAGTVQWSWGLDSKHDRGSNPPSADMQQATVNLLADMGVQPGTMQAGLVMPVWSTDNTPPTATINLPVAGSVIVANSTVTISGTATDAGGAVGGVEISFDGGSTWHRTSGTENWSFDWTPQSTGVVTIKTRAFDDS
jgi:hypothetical protein